MNEVGYFDEANVRKPLMHLWSLSVEEQFYFLWPACLVLLGRAGMAESPRKMLGVIACLGILSFALHVLAFKQNGAAVHYSPIVRFWQLLLGAALAATIPPPNWQRSAVINAPSRQYWHHVASGTGLAAIVIGGFLIHRESAITALVPAFGAALVIAAGNDSFLNKAVLSQPAVVGLGLISYALYLWHWPILSFLRMIAEKDLASPVLVIAMLVSVGLASATYLFVERPIRRGGNKAKIAAVLFAITLAIGVLGFAIYTNRGFEGRPGIAQLEKARAQFVGPLWQYTSNKDCFQRFPCRARSSFFGGSAW